MKKSQYFNRPKNSKVLSVTNLRKIYGRKVAVDDISFYVDGNEIVGILGPNGAWKTTTIKMILVSVRPKTPVFHVHV